MRHYIGSNEIPPAACGLDLATCVFNNDTTRLFTYPIGGAACSYNSDGTEAWVHFSTSSGSNGIYGFTLATPYEGPGGTIGNNGNNLLVAAEGMDWSDNGTKLFLGGTARVYDLSTPYDMSTAVLSSVNAALNSSCVTITYDGRYVYRVVGAAVTRWDLSVAWDLTTAVDSGYSTTFNTGTVADIAVGRCQGRLYTVSTSVPKSIYEYVMSIPGQPDTIPQSGGFAVPNFSIDITGIVTNAAGITLSQDQKHLLVSGAVSSGFNGTYIFSYTGDAI